MSYDCSWILENIGSVNLYTFDFVFLALPQCSRYAAEFLLNIKVCF